ncbi:MAG: sugar phosphate nucleotidyltransferase, partial [Coriobacteriia bacterium]|nr:sugar phosphate nucleotidyltransferase [Coriobacteriia bacterium]
IDDILLISTPQDIDNFKRLLGDGSALGIKLSYAVQASPDGLAQAFIIGEDFLAGEPCAMILGDNIFYGADLWTKLEMAAQSMQEGKATIFGYRVKDPERFGIVEIDDAGRAISLEEKPEHPKSNICVTGIYFYDKHVVEYAKQIKPSSRGELEITDLNRMYMEKEKLQVEVLGRGYAWFDAGTIDSLFEANLFVRTLSLRQSQEISSPEEIAYINGWISEEKLLESAKKCGISSYGEYLAHLNELVGTQRF